MELDADFIAFCKQSVALEQRMAKQAGKRLNEAMRNNIQDINVLDRIADQLFDTMSGLSGAGERTYMKYIKYLETFNPQVAKETKDAEDDDYFDDEEEYIEEDHPINRAYREWNDYEDEIPAPVKKTVTEQTSEQKSSEEDQKTQPEKNETSVKKEKGLEVFDLNDL